MKILLDGDPILKQRAEAYTIDEIKSPATRVFTSELFNTMFDNGGIGIAAPQVGVLKRVICVHIHGFSEIMFNPVILSAGKRCKMTEGCLSFPGKQLNISRSGIIKVKWLDSNGKLRYESLRDLAARVVLHECDHLNGITFDSYEVK